MSATLVDLLLIAAAANTLAKMGEKFTLPPSPPPAPPKETLAPPPARRAAGYLPPRS